MPNPGHLWIEHFISIREQLSFTPYFKDFNLNFYKLKQQYIINVKKRADRFELVRPKVNDNSGHFENACNLLVKSETAILHLIDIIPE